MKVLELTVEKVEGRYGLVNKLTDRQTRMKNYLTEKFGKGYFGGSDIGQMKYFSNGVVAIGSVEFETQITS